MDSLTSKQSGSISVAKQKISTPLKLTSIPLQVVAIILLFVSVIVWNKFSNTAPAPQSPQQSGSISTPSAKTGSSQQPTQQPISTTLDVTSSGQKIVGTVTIKNNTNQEYPEMYYVLYLREPSTIEKTTQQGKETNLIRIGSLVGYKTSEQFDLHSQESKAISFSLPYSPLIASGSYSLQAFPITKLGVGVGGTLKDISLAGNGQFVQIDEATCKIVIADKEYDPSSGPTADPNQPLFARCIITNPSAQSLSLHAAIDYAEREVAQYPLSPKFHSEPKDLIQLAPHETKVTSIALPSVSNPQVYQAELRLLNQNNDQISQDLTFRWVIRGASAWISSATLDKDYYRSGESATTKVVLNPSMDLYGNAGVNSGTNLTNAVISISILSNGALCGSAETHLPSTSSSTGIKAWQNQSVAVKIQQDCLNPTIEAKILNGQSTLSILSVKIITSAATLDSLSGQTMRRIALTAFFVILLTALAAALWMKYGKKKNIPTAALSILLIALGVTGALFSYTARHTTTAEPTYADTFYSPQSLYFFVGGDVKIGGYGTPWATISLASPTQAVVNFSGHVDSIGCGNVKSGFKIISSYSDNAGKNYNSSFDTQFIPCCGSITANIPLNASAPITSVSVHMYSAGQGHGVYAFSGLQDVGNCEWNGPSYCGIQGSDENGCWSASNVTSCDVTTSTSFNICNSGVSCSGSCSAPTNTCSTNNGTQGSCVYTTYSGGGSCTQTGAPNQSCTLNNCSSGYVCTSGSCVLACTNSAPSSFSLSSPANGSTNNSSPATLSWSAPSSWGTVCAGSAQDQYQVYFGTRSTPPSVGIYSSSTTSYTTSSLTQGITYYWEICASNNGFSTQTCSSIDSFTATTLTANLTANGQTSISQAYPLDGVTLSASAGGTATGTMNYIFYCNRSDTGTNVTSPYDAKFNAVTANPETVNNLCNYTAPGIYYAKVIVERGPWAAQSQVDIILTNTAPTVSGLTVDPPSAALFCGNPQEHLSWTFSDQQDGSTQTAYQLQVDNDSNFSSPEFDSGVTTSPSQGRFVPVSSNPFTGQLGFNAHYYWRVQVFDSANASSGWVSGPAFNTPVHAWPSAAFTWSPTTPNVGITVDFTDQTIFASGSSNHSWLWTIPNTSYVDHTSSTTENPHVQFNSQNSSTVTLQASDDAGSCSASATITSHPPLPHFREIQP